MPPAPSTGAEPRHPGLDALKARLTLLVVFHHAAITYGAIGGWFDREVPHNGSISSWLLMFFCTFNQAYFMGLFFLIAGYFTPDAIRRKGARGFLRDRLLRLGLPLLFFGWVLGPVTVALAQTRRGKGFWQVLSHQWQHGAFENGPLWFAQALLVFSLAAVVWLRLRGTSAGPAIGGFPSNARLLAAALACGAMAFLLRLVWPVGTQVWGLQLGYFASYVLLFAAGYMAFERGWLAALPTPRVKTWRRVMWLSLPTLLLPGVTSRFMPALQGDPMGGWNISAVVYAFWEPLVAWGVILRLLSRAQEARSISPSRLQQALARRAYAIYIIHPLVLVGVTIAWATVPWPPLLKFLISGSVACVLCFVLAGGLLRVPGLSRVI